MRRRTTFGRTAEFKSLTTPRRDRQSGSRGLDNTIYTPFTRSALPSIREAESIEETSHPRIGHDGGRARDMFHAIQIGGKVQQATAYVGELPVEQLGRGQTSGMSNLLDWSS